MNKLPNVIARIANARARGVIRWPADSKHACNGLSAPIVREPQDDSALLLNTVLITFFCLFLSITTFAQKKDTVSTDTAKRLIIVDASPLLKKAAKPLIILNGKIYKRNFKTIDTAKIESIRILKDKDAAQYGSKGKNGVVIITTKQ